MKLYLKSLLFCSLLFFDASAQVSETLSSYVNKDSTLLNTESKKAPPEQLEAMDIVIRLFHFKPMLATDTSSIKEHKVFFVFLPGFGYSLQTNITVVASTNISFYTGKKQQVNLSTINSDLEYSPSRRQIILPIIISIWTQNNKINWTGDCRYLKFPSYAFGMGGNTSVSNAFKVDYSYLKISIIPYRLLRNNFFAGLGYNLDYHWNIKDQNSLEEYKRYTNNATSSVSSGITLNLKYDGRKNSNNPQAGVYCGVSLRNNFKVLGSNKNWKSLTIDLRKYKKLSDNPYHLLAFWSYNSFAFGDKVPYFDLPSIGSDSYALTGRGYIPGKFRGNKFVYMETEYRFGLTQNGLLGGVAFANAATISEWPNNKFRRINPAVGAGLRIKVNKQSNVNYGIDYGIGLKKSRGFFIHLSELF